MSFFSFLVIFRFLSFRSIVHIAPNIVYFNFSESESKNLPCLSRERSLFTEALKIYWSTLTEIEANYIWGYREKEKSKKDKKKKVAVGGENMKSGDAMKSTLWTDKSSKRSDLQFGKLNKTINAFICKFEVFMNCYNQKFWKYWNSLFKVNCTINLYRSVPHFDDLNCQTSTPFLPQRNSILSAVVWSLHPFNVLSFGSKTVSYLPLENIFIFFFYYLPLGNILRFTV